MTDVLDKGKLADETQIISMRVHELGDAVREGRAEKLPAYVAAWHIKKAVDDVFEYLKQEAMDEARQQKGSVVLGKRIGYTEGKRTPDFSKVPVVVDLEAMLKKAKEQAVALIATAGSGGTFTVAETGEVLVAAVDKRGASTITLTEP